MKGVRVGEERLEGVLEHGRARLGDRGIVGVGVVVDHLEGGPGEDVMELDQAEH